MYPIPRAERRVAHAPHASQRYHQRVRTIEREASGGGAPVTGSFAEFKKSAGFLSVQEE